MSNTKLNCCGCGKEFGFNEIIYSCGDLWRCEDCAIKLMKESDKKDQRIADLEAKLAEKERQYETLYKLFSEQHEIIDQNELECFEEVNRLLKEQKDFYIVEKAEYDKMKQGAKDIVDKLKQQLVEKEKDIKWLTENYNKERHRANEVADTAMKHNYDMAIQQLQRVKETFVWGKENGYLTPENAIKILDQIIREIKGE